MSEFGEPKPEENPHIAEEAERELLENINVWLRGGHKPEALEETEFIVGQLAYLAEKEDHEFSERLLRVLRKNRVLLSQNEDIRNELEKILDKLALSQMIATMESLNELKVQGIEASEETKRSLALVRRQIDKYLG